MLEKGTSYFSVRDPKHAEEDLDRFKENGLNAVLHTFSERDRQYYTETMAEIVEASHDRDFTVYMNPWSIGRVFGGEALSEFIGKHPESCQVLSTGDRVPTACFNDPEFREYMRGWVADAAEIGADVLFWDEPHWYIPEWFDHEVPEGTWTCRCESCQELYEQEYDEQMPATRTERIDEFREASLLSFLDEMMELTAEKGLENAVCLLPSEDSDHGLRDWERLAANEHLDVLVTDPYWAVFDEESPEFISYFTDTVVSLSEEYDLKSQIWIQGFRLDDDPETIDDVRKATRAAIDGGVDSVFMWGYDACRSISGIACEDPDAVWNAYLDELPAE
ncbi:hypothetical protein [Natrarchaeobius oligotrophus]|uniref:DUF4015 domain-containing protein n=1 Tax=Natrarchaeobius chitinivorans TaxID=1679083 RepID=A0A3N6MWC6_NATCH|nr:hypothetical protein [Natrarchaeobius chitinivorans]RQG99256.1 hypothetical protein EA472_15095 [Natrarchaeobius chitinivorans]